jgi:hypothetical protein
MFHHRSILCVAYVVVGSLVSAPACRADFIFGVTVDTSALVNNSRGPFQIDFQLVDGSGTGDGNNTAKISNFQFGGGSARGSPTLIGGALGSLSAGVTITDTSFLNEMFQPFNAGSTLSFKVDLTTNVDTGPTPDLFSFALLDNTGANIITSSPDNAFVEVNISPPLSVQAFSSEQTDKTAPVPTPEISFPQAVPEPASIILMALGTLGFGGGLLWRRWAA